MSIQIDKSLFLPQLKRYAEQQTNEFQDNCVDLGRDVLDVAQKWFDEKPWSSGKREDFDTQRECRIELKRYVMNRLPMTDPNCSWYIPNFIWMWLAGKIVTYVIKLIIEHYWPDLMNEMGLDV